MTIYSLEIHTQLIHSWKKLSPKNLNSVYTIIREVNLNVGNLQNEIELNEALTVYEEQSIKLN